MARKRSLDLLMEEAVDFTPLLDKKAKEMSDKEIEQYLLKRENLREEINKLLEKERKKVIKTVLENSYILDGYDVGTILRLKEETGFDFWVVDDLHNFFYEGAKAEEMKSKVLLIPKVNAKVSFNINIKEIVKVAKRVEGQQKTLSAFSEV